MTTPLRIRIYLEDTDAGGIVYNASYVRFLERARTETLRAAGLQQSVTFQQDLSFVVHSLNLRFVSPAHLDDEVRVSCELSKSSGASLSFRQEVRDHTGEQLHCSAEVIVACIKLSSRRPCRVPARVLDALRAVADS